MTFLQSSRRSFSDFSSTFATTSSVTQSVANGSSSNSRDERRPASPFNKLSTFGSLGSKVRSYTVGALSHNINSDEQQEEQQGKRSRRSSRLLPSFTALALDKTPPKELRDGGNQSSSSASSSFEKQQKNAQGYSIAEPSSSDEEHEWRLSEQNDKDAPPDQNNIHISSAAAYLDFTDKSIATKEIPTASPPSRNRRLSMQLLTRKKSKQDLLSSPISATTDTSHSQDDIDPRKSTSSFNLKAFRNVREGAKSPEAASADQLLGTLQQRPVLPRNSHRVSSTSLKNPTISPLSSNPGTPKMEKGRASFGNGSISAGMFMRGAAVAASRSRQDVSSSSAIVDDDEQATSSIYSTGVPYRPLTPMGSGARSPGEELALLEADLARAKTNSLAYLAQMEEEQLLRQERRRQQRRRSRQNTSESIKEDQTSYFPPIGAVTSSSSSSNISRPVFEEEKTLSQLLQEKLMKMEKQVQKHEE